MLNKFNSLQEITNQFKSCIICNKPLILTLDCLMKNTFKKVKFTLIKSDLYYIGINKFYRLYIDVNDNTKVNLSIKNGDNLFFECANLWMKCKTCHHHINLISENEHGRIGYYEFPYRLNMENIVFFIKNVKIHIMNYYSQTENNIKNTLWINNRSIDTTLNLEKIKTFKHLVKKINLIKTFQ